MDKKLLRKKLKISFIVPCYNCEKTIDETIASVLALKLENFEICLVDDGSKDNSWRKLKKWQKKFPDTIKIGKNPENRGGGFTRNVCFSMAKYPFIYLLDSDNVLHSDSVFRLINATEDEDNLITYSQIRFFYTTPFRWLKLFYRDLFFLKDVMGYDDIRKTLTHPVVSGNYLYKRDVFEKVGGYETDMGALESWSFGYKVLLAGYKYKIVPGAWYHHRVHLDSYWFRELDRNFENLRRLLLRFPQKFSEKEIEEIKTVPDVTKFLVNQKNDFFREKVNFPYNIPLKIHNFIFLKGK